MITVFKFIYAVILVLPDLIRLVNDARKYKDDKELKEKNADDTKKVKEAFRNRDADKLKRVFVNSDDEL
jgi:hypothetical protein